MGEGGGAPFTEVITDGDEARVRYVGKMYILIELDGLKTKDILRFARETYDRRWEKRFAEDLVEVLTRMGHKPGATVKLILRDPGSGRQTPVERAPMTEANRQAVLRARRRLDGDRRAQPRARATIGPREMLQSLHVFQEALEKRWSYLKPSGIDVAALTGAVRKRISDGMSPDAFPLELQKIIGRGIDGHASISGLRPSGAHLPFLIEPVGERYVAFRADRTGFLEKESPFIEKVDGLSINAWIKLAGTFVPNGSPQYVRRHGLRWMRNLEFLRGQSGLPASDSVKVELASRDGARRRTKTLPLSPRSPIYGAWPRTTSRELGENVGYLRLASMNAESPGEVRTGMKRFRRTRGLVVDVRDNGGGSRDALRVLHGYLLAPGARPRVVNAAVYRLHPDHRKDHLAARFMYPENWKGWTVAQGDSIASFKKTFKPEWAPPWDEFSEWHYLVLDRLDDKETYHYDRPVVVLMNAKCFSATDIFLAGLKGLPKVTLLGEPSGGGSARSRSVTLVPTEIRLRMGSMVSFQVDGRLFDGKGVSPDRRVDPGPAYFIGGRDDQLEAALKVIRER